jgi:hypothetical protein
MPRITIKPGYIFRFPTEADRDGYCQWLPHDARIFLISTAEKLSPSAIVELPVAFRILVFRDTPGRYGWTKVGVAPVPDNYNEPQTFAKQDPINGKISKYHAGQETPALYSEVAGLETVAAWAHPHIIERLLAQLAGKPSKFLLSVQVKP